MAKILLFSYNAARFYDKKTKSLFGLNFKRIRFGFVTIRDNFRYIASL
ncbi:hypothetical protein HMPREF9370_1188 [Neisseria wadsworthii 9715]|uniref:Uncharacterized protein n=1 Tax=Neisseria wadsworthii 9715 TaxID=1030841 RepID=G4CQ28_9NEIS|nr:hypothetical protein HMPREF9370_1188 [Neisseria wadsworthii 9715]